MRARSFAVLLIFAGCKKTEETPAPTKAPDVVPSKPKSSALEPVELGKALNQSASKPAKQPAVVAAGETPTFAWVEGPSVHVARWKNAGARFDGKGTLEMLGPINHRADRQGSRPRLALDKDGALFAAWIEMDPDDKAQLEVARFTGEAGKWTSLGTANTAKGYSPDQFDFAISSEGPVVVLSERSWADLKMRLVFRRFDGKTWGALGDDASISLAEGDDIREGPVLSADPAHAPVVVWKERKPGAPPFTVARRWDAAKAKWLDIEAPKGADSDSTLDADAGPGGATYLWMTKNVGVTPVMRLDVDGTRWSELGEPKCGSNPHAAFDVAGPLAVIATDAALCAWTHDGEWRLLGSGFSAKGPSVRDPAIAGDGPIFVVWQDVSAEPAMVRAVGFIAQ